VGRGSDAPPLFDVEKPAIAIAHLPALPGTPLYDEQGGPDAIVEWVRRDVEILTRSGFDAVLFCNENDRPYQLSRNARRRRDAGACRDRGGPARLPVRRRLPLGCAGGPLGCGCDGRASFIREVATGVYEADMGLWAPDAATLLRRRRSLDAEHVHVFVNVTPEFASSVGTRDIATTARSVSVSSLADAILVSGPMAGDEPSLDALRAAKGACADTAVFANTGVKSTNVADFLAVADGVIVGSDLKVDGGTWNPVDPERADRFMAAIREARRG